MPALSGRLQNGEGGRKELSKVGDLGKGELVQLAVGLAEGTAFNTDA